MLRCACALAASVCILASMTGCAKTLFYDDADRTQFDQYDRMRGNYAPKSETDIYGRKQPALRARLGRHNH
ncbi:MAG: hypothetical protein D8M59_16925 [Planctomycetes bacterium]|nr:hypothetical protein [Planctomycetota bacterium]